MSWVWEQAGVEGSELLLLLSLADHAGDDGCCFPSVRRLMDRARLSLRGVQTALRSLELKGLISTNLNAGPAGCNRYTIHCAPPATSAPRNICTPQITAQPPATSAPPPANNDVNPRNICTRNRQEPSVEPKDNRQSPASPSAPGDRDEKKQNQRQQEEQTAEALPSAAQPKRKHRSHSAKPYDPRFESAYQRYPKHEEKSESEVEWKAAVARLMHGERDLKPKSEDEACEFLELAAADYAVKMAGREGEFIRSMRRWLLKNTYLDYTGPPRAKKWRPMTEEEQRQSWYAGMPTDENEAEHVATSESICLN